MKRRTLFASLVLAGVSILWSACFGQARPASVDVILWFDTEDYLLPADDDACLRLAQMLTERNIRATFKVVGEKARVLEKRGRSDVISALRKHDIGFHANFHSVHPTPSEYLAECGLLDGMDEFVRREGHGAADVRRVFSVATLACYGQPGSSWAAQAIAALPMIGVAPQGVPCYVDEGEHVGLKEKPFWYAGALNVYHMGQNYTRMDLHDPSAVEPAKQRVSAIAKRLLLEDGGGLISIFYHPCEWVHREFWDGVNFRRGANPSREDWKAPPQRSAEETDAAFQRFSQYIDHIRNIPSVRFVTASDLPTLYPDAVRTMGATKEDLARLSADLANNAAKGIDFQILGSKACSLADQLELLTATLAQSINGKEPQFPLPAASLLGPDGEPLTGNAQLHVDWPGFRDATLDVLDFLRTQRRVPARVFIGPNAIAPGDFLVGLAQVYNSLQKNGKFPLQEGVTLSCGAEILPARHIAKDTPELFGGWIIHKEGFRAPKILEVARLQAWTLKPAIRE